MTRYYLKKAVRTSQSDFPKVRDTVAEILQDIETNGEDAVRRYAAKFDGYEGDVVLGPDAIRAAIARVPESAKEDIAFAHANVRRFAESQRATLQDTEIELSPGFIAGQRYIPCQSAGCYVPGGRYSHIASAIMTVTTAKVANCGNITACSPPSGGKEINPILIYTANLCGADTIISVGGVQGVATMAFGLFGTKPADILVGPGNQFVAEAKRILYGRVGIDMVAGPTDSLIIADETADAEIVAADLVGQAEHGYNSPVWLVTTSDALAKKVLSLVPEFIVTLPDANRTNAEAAWRDYGEIIICNSREEVAETADEYAPEHLSVQATDLDWWLNRLNCYGSLFLGEETTVAFGDKASGPNHVLPTARSARYTGGLSVHKFMKVVTWQRSTREGMKRVAEATARISRYEGMEGHARTADIRLARYFPEQKFNLDISG